MSFVRKTIEEMSAYIPGEKAVEENTIIINANENPYEPSAKAIKAMQKAINDIKWYPESSSQKVRKAAGELYNIDPEMVMLANSSDEMLRILCQACLNDGDEAYAFYPSFPYYKTLCQVQNAKFCEIEFTEDYSISELPDMSKAKLVFFPNPGAPSGLAYSLDTIKKIIEAASNALVVIDEAYNDFYEPEFSKNEISAIPLLKEYSNLVVTRTFSKSYSLAGLRIGLGFASKMVMQELNKVRDYYNVDKIAQAGAAAALEDQESLIINTNKIIKTREWFSNEIKKYSKDIIPSSANFVLVEFEEGLAKKLYTQLKKQKVLVRYWDKPRLNNSLRITIGTDEQMQKVLNVIIENLNNIKN